MHGMPDIPQPRDARYVRSADGTRICYSVYGDGDQTLVLSPGLATPSNSYDYIIERFSPRLRIITFDMRGTYRSDTPKGGVKRLRVEDSADDLIAVADAEGVDHFLMGGWSMGVQISLEVYNRFPERCDGLFLVNGPYGHMMRHTQVPFMHLVMPSTLRLLMPMSGLFGLAFRAVLPRHPTVRALKAAGLVSGNVPFFVEVLRDWSMLNFRRYTEMTLNLNQHTAEPYLANVRVPTVITAGKRDIMTPVKTAKHMAALIPDAELMVSPRGTHYTLIEFPEFVNEALERLLVRIDPS